MTNESWTRVPSILSTVTSTFSDELMKQEVLDFKKTLEDGNQIGSLASTFDNIIRKQIVCLFIYLYKYSDY